MHTLIIGNGIAGITTALEIRKNSSHPITIISSESPLFFSRPAMMFVFMGISSLSDITPYSQDFFKKKNITLLQDEVISISALDQTVLCKDSKYISFDHLVIASGSIPIKPEWAGIHLDGVHYFYHLSDLLKLSLVKNKIKSAAIIGGGLIGVELAEMLLPLKIPIHFLIKDNGFWKQGLPDFESEMTNKHLKEKKIKLHLNTEVSELHGNPEYHIRHITCSDNSTFQVDFAGIAIGVAPNISCTHNSGILTDKGILVNNLLQTNFKNIYAAGDCAQLQNPLPNRNSVEATWYIARQMGESLGKTLTGNPTAFNQNIWFNAAKFFDLEFYQFGHIPLDSRNTLLFSNSRKNKSLRIAFNPKDDAIQGFLSMNIRLDQNLCELWIREKYTINDVTSHLTPILKKEKIESI